MSNTLLHTFTPLFSLNLIRLNREYLVQVLFSVPPYLHTFTLFSEILEKNRGIVVITGSGELSV